MRKTLKKSAIIALASIMSVAASACSGGEPPHSSGDPLTPDPPTHEVTLLEKPNILYITTDHGDALGSHVGQPNNEAQLDPFVFESDNIGDVDIGFATDRLKTSGAVVINVTLEE